MLLIGDYERGLPFRIHTDLVFCSREEDGRNGFRFEDYEWDQGERAVAEAAVEHRRKISVSVPGEYAHAVGMLIAGQLKRRVVGRYDEVHQRLVMWDMDPRDDC